MSRGARIPEHTAGAQNSLEKSGTHRNNQPKEKRMNIGSICTRDPVTIDEDMNLTQAAQRMRDEHVGALVVTGPGPEGPPAALGVVTDRDLAIEVLARGRDGASVSVGSLLSGRLVAVPHDATLSEALVAMEGEGVRRLLVTGPAQELLGIVSIDDLIDVLAGDMARLAQSLRKAREREMRGWLPAIDIEGMPLVPGDIA
jgi:CBS domain-containing protein